jgi:peptidoglycan/xylan/chitin deacetylase (PgdA/CDA1 family)
VPFWRPPYGAYNSAVLDAAASVGYTKTFHWDVDTIDWRPISEGGPTAESMARKVVNNAVGGTDVLMHLGGWETLDALPAMIDGLRSRGFLLTSLSDMLEH